MGYKHWNLPPARPAARRALEQAGVPPLLAAVLAARGLETWEQVRPLITLDSTPLHPPMELKDMEKAVERIQAALDKGESIAVYGDYDVDGITSTCLLTHYLTARGGSVLPYIPDRLEEGYGLNQEAISSLAQQGVSLIITVDCGITATQEVAHAASLGLDVVITDHHECKQTLPPAVAVIDPHRPDCTYPFSGLAGVGVALKLAMALAGPDEAQQVFEDYSDLAAIGTVADVMPMLGENRTIVQRGLMTIAQSKRLGLSMLIQAAGLGEKPLSAVSIGYTLAPRLNAAGRMGRASLAAELLLSNDPERAAQLAYTLCELNRTRQGVEGEIFQTCVQRLEQSPQNDAILLADPQWHQGVLGIVASRLAEKYGCPTFMVCVEHGIGKGSCRSWGGINLFQVLAQCSDLLESFGGHALAAGFTVQEEKLDALAQRLRQGVLDQSKGEELPCVLETDGTVLPQELTVEQVEQLELLEPCGLGNPRPVLVLTGVHVLAATQVGRGRHLRLRLETRGVSLDGIFFSADGAALGIVPGCRIDVAFYPQINEFRGVRSVQLQIIDLRHALTRSKLEQSIYDKYRRNEPLTPHEAQSLLPSRGEFVTLWRYLEKQGGLHPHFHDSLTRMTRTLSRANGLPEIPTRTLLTLEVLEERGLLTLSRQEDHLEIQLHRRPGQKVDLEASSILQMLRAALGDANEREA